MAQNIYDDPDFLAGYRTLARSQHGLDGAPEWPTMQTLLPELHGSRVVDLGCGFGWFSRWAADAGAASVLGVDISREMLREANTTSHEVVRYERGDLDTYELTPASTDLVYSSLALHYLTDIDRLTRSVSDALVPGGRFVFSVEHPIFSATTGAGFQVDETDGHSWPITGYLDEGERLSSWFADGVRKQHRTVESYVMAVITAGLTLTHLIEWGPSTEQVKANPTWAIERERPMFLLVSATC